ncbi:GATOR1 complex protein NPRL3 isoform X2 [Macrobrachium rosenbergii]|uniref:GATOR1 complex protein NPRL3 isoform X2 n=1 Tax=Macrobrachium rosenbergii TaxID=79674 RepID=UPI0034D6473E
MDVNPLGIILVKNGSRGDRLLFRYPFSGEAALETKSKNKRRNPYSLIEESPATTTPLPQTSNIMNGKLAGFSDKVMSNLFAVKSELCDKKFELKVNDVRFVGHPVRLNPHEIQVRPQEKRRTSTIILFNIVFALKYEGLLKGLQSLKPYHTLLLLVERSELLRSLSADASPALRRLLYVESPLCPFYTLAADADLTLPQVFMLAGHLVYWGKATVIYPLCNTNVYVLAPNAPTAINSPLTERFSEQFPGSSLHRALAEFSLPSSLSDKCHPMNFAQHQQEQVQQVLWLLRHGLLQQLHTYIYLAPPITLDGGITRSSGRDFGGTGQLGSHGTSSPASTSIPTPTVHEPPPLTHDPPSLAPHPHIHHHNDTTRDALHHAVAQLSQPASESDLGSVCSDERSPSPGVSISTIPDDSVRRQLDTFLSVTEKEMVMKVEAAQNPEDLKLFSKLCMFFRGKHHLEEMMYRVNLRRSQLLQIIDKFRQVLYTCQHPDESLNLTDQTI